MGTDKRARQKAARADRLAAEWQQGQRQRRTKGVIRFVVIGALIVGAVVLWSLFTSSDDETVATATTATTSAPTTVAPTTAAPTTTVALPVAADGECPAEDGSSAPQTVFDGPQPLCIDPTEKYVAAFSTSIGDFDILIDPALDEITANNFITLARFHAYDDVIFHRIINNFVVQGGDVAGLEGVGDAGYKFTGGVPEAGDYRVGSIAMANSGGPDTNGSQFFIVTGPNGANLPPLYSLFGQVISGIEVPLAMQGVATGAGDKPVDDVAISAIDVRVATADDIAAYEAALS